MQGFRIAWANYDPDAEGFIECGELKQFLFDIGEPLGFDETYKDDNEKQGVFLETLCKDLTLF